LLVVEILGSIINGIVKQLVQLLSTDSLRINSKKVRYGSLEDNTLICMGNLLEIRKSAIFDYDVLVGRLHILAMFYPKLCYISLCFRGDYISCYVFNCDQISWTPHGCVCNCLCLFGYYSLCGCKCLD